MTAIALAATGVEVARHFAVMAELRSHLASEAEFVAQVRRQMSDGGEAS